MSTPNRRKRRVIVPIIVSQAAMLLLLLLLFAISSSRSLAQSDTAETPRRDVVILIDSSRSMVLDSGNDPAAKRIQFVQLLENYLARFAPESRLAVALFTSEVRPVIAPLTPVENLVLGSSSTTGEWLRQREFVCAPQRPSEGSYPSYPAPPEFRDDPCYGTNYVAALEWAHTQLEPDLEQSNCAGPEAADCHIFVFTDMAFGDPDSTDLDLRVVSSADEVAQTLGNIKASEIKTHIISFDKLEDAAPAPGAETTDAALREAAIATWRSWYELGNIANFTEAYTAADAWVKNGEILDMLELHKLPQLTAGTVTTTATLVPADPPDIATASVELLPDSDLFDIDFSTPPSGRMGRFHFWSADQLQLPLSMSVSAPQPVVIFYEVITSTRPLGLKVEAPAQVAAGQSFTVTAHLDVGRPLGESHVAAVTAKIQGSAAAVPLQYAGESRWHGILTAPESAETYTLSVQAEPEGWGALTTASQTVNVAEARRSINFWASDVAPRSGDRVSWHAQFYEDGRVVTLPETSSVSVQLEPVGSTVPLSRSTSALGEEEWSAAAEIKQTGTIRGQLVVTGDERWRSTAEKYHAVLHVSEQPTIELAPLPAKAEPGDDIAITVTVQGSAGLSPTLYIQPEGGEVQTEPLTSSNGIAFTTTYPMPSNTVTIWASVEDADRPGNVYRTEPHLVSALLPTPTVAAGSTPTVAPPTPRPLPTSVPTSAAGPQSTPGTDISADYQVAGFVVLVLMLLLGVILVAAFIWSRYFSVKAKISRMDPRVYPHLRKSRVSEHYKDEVLPLVDIVGPAVHAAIDEVLPKKGGNKS